MADSLAPELYTEAGRLASFKAKRRGSNAGGRGGAAKTAKWPHKWMVVEDLAEAGFYHTPTARDADNVTCFLCAESICAWEEGDDPFAAHLELSPSCGWAITCGVERKLNGLDLENPSSVKMVKARKDTFLGGVGDDMEGKARWPHETKRGWKCKVKAMVEAGWRYRPNYEGDDFAECVYCTLALDGWESGDMPFHEHHARHADCAFFELTNRAESPIAKKATTAKGKKAKAPSKRASTQAVVEAPSFIDQTLDDDEGDSVATVASTMSQAGRKLAKGKKPAAASTRGRKKKSVESDESVMEVVIEQKEEETKKSTRGRTRKSDEMEEEEATAPPPPKRRTRNSVAVAQESALPLPQQTDSDDEVLVVQPKKKAPAKKKVGRASRSRKVSNASQATSVAGSVDERLDQDLEAELDRQLENMDVDDEAFEQSPPRAKPLPARRTRSSVLEMERDVDMFGTNDVEVDEAALEAELEAMEVEEEVSKPLPKAKKGGTRKVSAKQTAAEKKRAAAEAKAARLRAEEEEREQAEYEAQQRAEREAAEEELRQAEREAEERRLQDEADALARQRQIEAEEEEERLQIEAEKEEKRRVQAERAEKKRLAAEAKAEEQRAKAEAKAEEQRAKAEAKAEEQRLKAEAAAERKRAREAEQERLRLEAEEEAENERLRIEAQKEARAVAAAKAKAAKTKKSAPAPVPTTRTTRSSRGSRNMADESMLSHTILSDAESPEPAPKPKRISKGKGRAAPKSPTPPPQSSSAPSSDEGEQESLLEMDRTMDRSPELGNDSIISNKVRSSGGGPQRASRSSGLRSSQRSARKERSLTPELEMEHQSSDAENRPPSLRLSDALEKERERSVLDAVEVLNSSVRSERSRIPLAGSVGRSAQTPTAMAVHTPSRRAMEKAAKRGLVSDMEWEAVDLDQIFSLMRSPEKENREASPFVSRLKGAVSGGELSEMELEMSVEEWVRWNAKQAEEGLRERCEKLVGVFEAEGQRALRVLEGIRCEDEEMN